MIQYAIRTEHRSQRLRENDHHPLAARVARTKAGTRGGSELKKKGERNDGKTKQT